MYELASCYDSLIGDPALLAEMSKTEVGITFLADQALQSSIISVEVRECDYPLLNLDTSLDKALEGFKKKPSRISSIDLELDYDQTSSRYAVQYGALNFDTKDTLLFRKVRPPKYADPNSNVYVHFLRNAKGKIAEKLEYTEYLSQETVRKVLSSTGIDVPEMETEANIASLENILHFAKQWTALTTRAVEIDSLNTALIVDKIEGSKPAKDSLGAPLDGMNSREISFCVDVSELPGMAPSRSMKIQTFAPDRISTPTIYGIWNVGVEYKLPMSSDGILISFDPVRHELGRGAVLMPLDVRLLQAARSTIGVVSKII